MSDNEKLCFFFLILVIFFKKKMHQNWLNSDKLLLFFCWSGAHGNSNMKMICLSNYPEQQQACYTLQVCDIKMQQELSYDLISPFQFTLAN